MPLEGVKVGPLDPDATEAFGHVAQNNSARTLIRLHGQMYPPTLRRALARPLQEGHTKAVHEHLDAVSDHVSGLTRENGDPMVPEGARVVGAAVRGDRATGQVLTFTYELPSGRTGKWFAPYLPEALPEVYEIGTHYARVHQMREQGLVAFDQEATGQELYRRQLSQSQAEIKRLRAALEGRSGENAENIPSAQTDVQPNVAQVEELERLRRESEELRRRNGELEALFSAGGGGVPTGGLEADIAGGQRQEASEQTQTAAQEPPFEGFDGMNAEQLREYLKAEGRSGDEVRAVLEYEKLHANRRSVVSTAEQQLDRG